ncbi:hypothetical protein PISMIDRAFT_110989 [Pisolithus microcarpus 441]|uniref:6-phosphofructokinase n=1 Tax=Pisolithus microcarpus 441 TaxID=765257 RepID=A0A0C9YU86_9AGAM|nr:hypothetical protein PISMIDRAFT_110989 [Pisolithus microcarpus 441]
MKLAVLTSGGDSAGMNAVVRAVVKAGILNGCETWIVREGYEGLVRGNTDTQIPSTIDEPFADPSARQRVRSGKATNLVENLRFGDGDLLHDGTGDHARGRTLKGRYIVRAGWDDVRGWFADGGTLIGTARSKTFRSPAGRLAAAYNLIKEGIDALVVCGGDGSLTGADLFRSEWPSLISTLHSEGKITDEQLSKHGHLRIVGLVGSIDNDMSMTDLTIGAPTALHRICEAIDNINSTATSHSRAFVLEVMGRHCGWLALLAGVSAGADFIFIPERPPQTDSWEDEMCEAISMHREVGKRKTLVIVAEGAHDSNLKPIRADYVRDVLTERLGLDSRVTTLGHIQRGGRPCAFDRILVSWLFGSSVVHFSLVTCDVDDNLLLLGKTGASLVYTPEQGMDLDMLRADVKFLKIRYGLDAKGKSEGRLVIRNECASKVYTTDMLTDMFREEGGGLFDSRYASLGHILQGGVPTPMDRARAARLSLRCMAFLEEHHQSLLAQPPKSRCAPPESAAVITIQGSALKWVPVTEMVKHADMKNRRGKEAWWEPVKGWVEALSGRSELV